MWNLLPSERLRCWQDFRKSISQKNFEDALKETTHLWSYAPYQAHYLTTDQINEWPGPWELIYENYYCDLAKALGIVYTLLDYLQKCEKNFDSFQIYPDFVELSLHLANIQLGNVSID